VELNVTRAGGREGDVFELAKAAIYTSEDSVKDVNSHRGVETEKIRLVFDGSKLAMVVDGKGFPFHNYRLKALNGEVSLRGKLEAFRSEIGFFFDGSEVTPKFGGRRVQSFNATERGLEMRYLMGNQLLSTHSDVRVLDESRLEPSEIVHGLTILDRRKKIEGSHTFQLDPSLYAYVYSRLSTAGEASRARYVKEKGELGEDLGLALLIKMGMEGMVRHPFDKTSPGPGSHKKRTDVLVRSQSNEQWLAEFRWWKNAAAGLDSAIINVKQRKIEEKSDKSYGEIKGAYAVVLDLKKNSRTGELRIKRVW